MPVAAETGEVDYLFRWEAPLMPLQSMRGKLTLVLVLLTCAPLLIMGLMLLYQAENHVLDQTEDRLAGIARSVDSMLAPNLKKMLDRDPSLGLARVPLDQQDAVIRQTIAMPVQKVSANHPRLVVGFHSDNPELLIVMVDGVERPAQNPVTGGPPGFISSFATAPTFSRQASHHGYMYSAPIIRDGALIGHVFASLPSAEVTIAMWQMRLTTIGGLLLTLLVAWWVAERLAHYLLTSLFAAAQQVASGIEATPTEMPEFAPLWAFFDDLMGSRSSLATDLLNALPLGVTLYNSELKVAFSNQFYADMLGMSRDEIIGADYDSLTRRIFPPEDLQTRVLPAVHTGQAETARQRQTVISSTGERIPVETVAFPYGSGSLQGVLVLVYDLRQDEDLAQVRKILSFVNDVGPVGMVTLDKDGTITEFNRAMARICDLPRTQALGRGIGELFPSLTVDPDGTREFRNQTISCPCGNWKREPICPCGHHGRHLVVDGTITRDGRGVITGTILVFRDITQLREMESRLHDAMQQAQFLLDALDVAVVAVDSHGRISIFNQVAEYTTGLAFGDIQGEDISNLALSPGLIKPLLTSLDQGLPQRNQPITWSVNGEKHSFIMDCSPLRDTQGNVAAAMAMFRDITTLRKLEQEMQRAEKLSVIGQLAAGTAHEIRNPLTTVRGFLQLLKEKCRQHDWLHEVSYIDLMLSEIDRINHVISEFLMLSKDRAPMLKSLHLDLLLSDISAILESEAILRGINIRTEMPGHPIPILGDSEQLKQVFLNLATNAFQAMGPGDSLTIIIRCSEEMVAVDVSDTGGGIPPELLTKIFDPFFTTKEEGTGLGLSICNRIIHDHHGEIHVRSTIGEGTTVTVEMPVRKLGSPSPLAPRPS